MNGVESKEPFVSETTVGRALLSEILPEGLPFDLVNQAYDKESNF